MRITSLVLALGITLLCAVSCGKKPDPQKMAQKPNGATSLTKLSRDGEYYVVRGADIHNLCGELLGKKVRFRGKVDKTQGSMWGLSKPLLRILADDGEFYLWISGSASVPSDLTEAVKKGGLQVPQPVELWCTLSELPSEEVLTAYSELSKRSGITKHVDRWGR